MGCERCGAFAKARRRRDEGGAGRGRRALTIVGASRFFRVNSANCAAKGQREKEREKAVSQRDT